MNLLYDGIAFHEGMQGGGIHRYAVELISHMTQIPDVDTVVYADAKLSLGKQAQVRQVKEFRLRENHRFCQWAKRINAVTDSLTGRLLPFRTAKPDIFHLTYYRMPCQFGSVVVTLYDTLMERFPQFFPGSYCDKVRYQKRCSLQAADHVICISESCRQDAIEWFQVPPDRTSVIYLAANLPSSHSPDSTQSPLVDRPYLLHVGHRWEHKNFARLLQAFAALSYGRDILLVSVGGLPDWSSSEKEWIQQLGIGDRVLKLARVEDSALHRLYQSALCTVYPSLYEGFGLPVLEALQAGGIVATSNTSSLPEVAGNAGIYFDPTDLDAIGAALTQAIELSPQQRQTQIALGQKQASQFSWETTAQQTYEVYQQLLQAR